MRTPTGHVRTSLNHQKSSSKHSSNGAGAPVFGDPLTIAVLGALLAFFVVSSAQPERSATRVAAIENALQDALPTLRVRARHPTLDQDIRHLVADLPGILISASPEGYPIAVVPFDHLFQAESAQLIPGADRTITKLQRLFREHARVDPRHTDFKVSIHLGGQDIEETQSSPGTLIRLLEVTHTQAQILRKSLQRKERPEPSWILHLEPYAGLTHTVAKLELVKTPPVSATRLQAENGVEK